AALLLELADVAVDDIVADYVASDEHLQSLYEEWSMREPDPEQRVRILASFRSDAAQIMPALEYVRQRGGIAAYLRDAGVPDDTLGTLRRRLVDPRTAPR